MSEVNYFGDIITVKELLEKRNMYIPEYQRPYKWTERNVKQLLDDIIENYDKETYRLGTIVFHIDNGACNIVDGQQRIVTLLLILKALRNKKYNTGDVEENFTPNFENPISIRNIRRNYTAIEKFLNQYVFQDKHVEFLLKCEVVTFNLSDISEAFQFFDSQNSRGKSLDPHDLLKAYHLREYVETTEDEMRTTINLWENIEPEKLNNLFSDYLYRVKKWSQSQTIEYFSKNDIDMFKGITLSNQMRFPYLKPIHIITNYIDNYNTHSDRNVDLNKMGYPFSFDSQIINGKLFFEMVAYYNKLVDNIKEIKTHVYKGNNDNAKEIISILDNYNGWWRTGDLLTRNLFNCVLVYYVDKFGYHKISEVVVKIFQWAYQLRLHYKSYGIKTIRRYAVEKVYNGCSIFELIRNYSTPEEFLNFKVTILEERKENQQLKRLMGDLYA